MPTRKSTKSRADTGAASAPDILKSPANIVSDRLNRAHATLDLIYTAVSLGRDQGQMFLEQLDVDTLDYALNNAMHMIDEARKANELRAAA